MELVILGWGLLAVTRLARDRALFALTVLSFLLRLLVGLSLYAISAWGVPIFPELHHPHRGFWMIAPDADLYDGEARSIAGTWHGRALDRTVKQTFSSALAVIYAIFGDSPTQGLLFNAFAAAACVPLGYWIASLSRMGRRASLIVAGLLALWPSSFAWSGQLLKDPLQWLGLFAMVAGAALLLSSAHQCTRPGLSAVTISTTLVLAGSLVTAWLRGHVTPAWTLAVMVGLGVLIATNRIKWHTWPLLQAGVLMVAVILGGTPAYTPWLRIAGMARSATEESIRGVAVLMPSAPALPTPSPVAVVHPQEPCPPAMPLLLTRQEFILMGGTSIVDASVQFNTCWDVLAYVPRAASLTFLGSVPGGGFKLGSSLGPARHFYVSDVILLWLLFPGLLVGLAHAFSRPTGVLTIVAVFVLILGVALGLAVANYGALFRLRLQVILPATVLAVDGWTLLLSWFHSRFQPWRTSFTWWGHRHNSCSSTGSSGDCRCHMPAPQGAYPSDLPTQNSEAPKRS